MDKTLRDSAKELIKYANGDDSGVTVENDEIPIVPMYKGSAIKGICNKMAKCVHHPVSLDDLAMLMGVPKRTVDSWLNDEAHPTGSSARLLQVFNNYPSVIKAFDPKEQR